MSESRSEAGVEAASAGRVEDGGRHSLRSILRSSTIYGAGAILPRALSFALLPLFTHYLPPSDYAIVGVGVMISAVLTLLYPMGMHGSMARLYFTVEQHERRALLATTWGTVAVVGGIATLLLDRFGPVISGYVFHQIPFDPYLRIAVWTAFFTALTRVPLASLQAQQRPALYVCVSIVTAVVSTAAAAILVVFYGQGATGYLRGALVGSIVGAAFCVGLLGKAMASRPTRKIFLAAAAYGLPLVPHGLAGWILDLSDRIILEHNVPLAELGRYSIAFQLGSIISFTAVAINTAWSPELFRSYQQTGDVDGLVRSSMTYYSLGMLWIAVGIAVLASPVIRILASPAYAGAEAIVPWLAAGFLLNALYFIPVNLLMLHARTRVIPLITIGAGAVNVALNLWLVPRYGVMAAAVNTAIAYAICFGATAVVASRTHRVRYEYARMTRGSLAILLAGATTLLISTASPMTETVLRGLALVGIPTVIWFWATSDGRRPVSIAARMRRWP